MNMSNIEQVVEELLKQLPPIFQDNQSHELLIKAIDVLNELLIFCKMNLKDKSRLKSDVEMKEEPEEDRDIETLQSDLPEDNFLAHSPVIIRVKRTEPESQETIMFHCPLCDMNFSYSDDLLNHDKEAHLNDLNEYKCPECDETNNREDILQHFAKEHSKYTQKRFKRLLYCPECDQVFIHRGKLRRHYFDAHKKWLNNRTCLQCLKVFVKEKDRRAHETTEHFKRKLCCRYRNVLKCLQEFNTYDELQQHYLSIDHQFQEIYTCHICGESFKKACRSHYLRHVQKHSMTERTVECPECDKKFFFEIDLTKHMKLHTKNYMCDICDYRASTKTYLKHHMRTHSDERPCICNICGSGFKHKDKLRIHMLSHSEVRRHKCEYCGKGFKSKKNLNEHTKIHTGKFSGYCEICRKGFTQKYNLTLHNLKHHQ